MLDISSINAVSGILAAIGVLVGVIFTVLQLRDLVKTRQTDLAIRLYSTFGSREFQELLEKNMTEEYKDYSDLVKRHGLSEFMYVGLFFEGLGVLLYRKLIDIGLVDDLFSGFIKRLWEKSKYIAEDARKQLDYPEFAEWAEYLYNEMQKRKQQLTTIQ